MLRTLFSATILAGALAGSAMAQAPDAGCVLPSEPKGIPAAIDAAITGPVESESFCVFLFTPKPGGAYSRMFAPEYGIAEDPATGSSTGPLAAYMIGTSGCRARRVHAS
jgi:hypothetical protein